MKMKNNFFPWTHCGVIFALIVLAAAGCRNVTPAVTFYNMTAMDRIEIEGPDQATMQDIKLGIGPVKFPSFLKRPQIVLRSGANSFNFAEYHRWGGSLDQDFLEILAEDLSILLSTNQVFIFPWRNPFEPSYRIECNVHQFDGRQNNSVTLNVTWIIREKDNIKALHVKRSIIHKSLSSKSYDALVSAHSQAIAELSQEIAEVIRAGGKK